MGLIRLICELFKTPIHRPRRRSAPSSYRPVSAPAPTPVFAPISGSVSPNPLQASAQRHEPLRQVGEQLGQQIIKGHCWVIDGDTIVINKVHIRLAGIDAPELDQPYGQNAKRALMALCRGKIVTAITDGSVSHERAVATCRLDDGTDLSAEMVKAGHALDWRKFSGGQYRSLEVEGIRKKLWRVDARQKGRMPPTA